MCLLRSWKRPLTSTDPTYVPPVMATSAGKHRHFNDGTRPPGRIPVAKLPHVSHEIVDDTLARPANGTNESIGANDQQMDLNGATTNSEELNAMNVEIDPAHVDAIRRPDPPSSPPGLGPPPGELFPNSRAE